jgi:hypothetical protein
VLAAGRMGEHCVLHGWQLVQGSFHGDHSRLACKWNGSVCETRSSKLGDQ